MKVHFLQHMSFEGPGRLLNFFEPRHDVSICHVYGNDPLPAVDDFDWLIIMGGSMGVHDEKLFPWMRAEKKLIHAAIAAEKRVLGICLGAQLIADVLGATVSRNRHREIGWFPVFRSPELEKTALASVFAPAFEVFQWHGDTFSIPKGASAIGSSAACDNQGFIIDERIVALQFHLEATPAIISGLIRHMGADIDGSRFVQDIPRIRGTQIQFERLHEQLGALLRTLSGYPAVSDCSTCSATRSESSSDRSN